LSVGYYLSTCNKNSESTSVYNIENEDEDDVETGQCSFVVHEITEEEFCTKSIKAIKAFALKYLTSEDKILEMEENIYKNS
jgi:hypothetical protein